MIYNYKTWKALNEAGWDSIDDDAGEIVINGVPMEMTISYSYDTSNPSLGMIVYIKPTILELIEIGAYSAGYAKLEKEGEETSILIYEKEKELKSSDQVIRATNESIYRMFKKDFEKNLPNPLSLEQFISIVKKSDWNTEDQGLSDIIIISDRTAPAYKMLGDFDLL